MSIYNSTQIMVSNPTDNPTDNFLLAVAKTNLVITLFGIIGNIICILVFFQKPLLSRKFNWYLLILAIAEFLFCCIVFTNSVVYVVMQPKMLFDLFKLGCFSTEYIINSIDAFCVFLTLLLSIDRLNAILDPINSRSFFTNRYPKRIILFSLLILLVLKSPEIILTQRHYINEESQLERYKNENNNNNTTNCDFLNSFTKEDLPACIECDRANKEAYIIICGIILPLLLNVIPTILILISNMILSIYVTNYKNKKSLNLIIHQRNKSKQQQQSEILTQTPSQSNNKNVRPNMSVTQKSHHFTIIIIGVWLLFTSAPFYTLNTIIRISNLKIFQKTKTFELTNNSEHSYMYQAILSTFFNSNHCINILIYLIFHKSFRYHSLKLFFKITKCDPTIYSNNNNNNGTSMSATTIMPTTINSNRTSQSNRSLSNNYKNRRYSSSYNSTHHHHQPLQRQDRLSISTYHHTNSISNKRYVPPKYVGNTNKYCSNTSLNHNSSLKSRTNSDNDRRGQNRFFMKLFDNLLNRKTVNICNDKGKNLDDINNTSSSNNSNIKLNKYETESYKLTSDNDYCTSSYYTAFNDNNNNNSYKKNDKKYDVIVKHGNNENVDLLLLSSSNNSSCKNLSSSNNNNSNEISNDLIRKSSLRNSVRANVNARAMKCLEN